MTSSSALSIATHTISMTVSDEVGAVCVDDIVIVGRPPVVSIASPGRRPVANSGEVVTFLGSATDGDEAERRSRSSGSRT